MGIASRWWKIDFHVHTPASNDYSEPDVKAEAWLMAAMAQELDAVVVADHNSGGWIDTLKTTYAQMAQDKPEGFRELAIFPGFELSVAGEPNRYHLICILDPSKGLQNLTACLGECGVRDDFGNEEKVSSLRGLEDIIQAVCNHGGLIIPAHINNNKGLIGTRQTLTPDLEKALKFFVAAEFCSPPTYTDGRMKSAVERLAVLGGSDAHAVGLIGTHFVWVKMGEPTIDALRMALCDSKDCVRSDGPAPDADFRLLSLSIKNLTDASGNSYCDTLMCSFASAMTAFIGGRGSGKSTVVRCVRDVFCRPPESSEDPDIERQWENYTASAKSAVLKVDFVMLGRSYRLTKKNTGEECLEEYIDDHWVESALGDVKSRFPVSVFGQKEVGELARRPDGLLALIDEAGDTKGAGWKEEWDVHSSSYLSLRIRERDLEQQVALLPATRVELADLERNISDYERKGGGDVLKAFQERSRQDLGLAVPDEIGGGRGWAAQIRLLAEKFVIPGFPDVLFGTEDPTRQEIKNVYDSYVGKLQTSHDALLHLADDVETKVSNYKVARDNTAWRRAHQAAVSAYKALCDENGGELHMEDYGKWVTKRNELVERVRLLEQGQNELAKVKSTIVEERKKLEELREELKVKRQSFIDRTLRENTLVKMTVRKFADRTHLENRLRRTLGVSDDWQTPQIENMLKPIMDWDSARQSANDLAKLLESIKSKLHKVLSGADTVSTWFDRKVRECWERNPSVLDEFDIWWPEDNVEVKYSMDDGTRFKPLTAGASAGQKATAMLAFLLSYGTNPILIDQPEDDIDNRLITQLLVRQLRENKNRRQVIVMTHNPNVVVNGGAESVAVMNFADGKVACGCQGPIDRSDVKKDICDIMEGGREAFRKRYNRELGNES